MANNKYLFCTCLRLTKRLTLNYRNEPTFNPGVPIFLKIRCKISSVSNIATSVAILSALIRPGNVRCDRNTLGDREAMPRPRIHYWTQPTTLRKRKNLAFHYKVRIANPSFITPRSVRFWMQVFRGKWKMFYCIIFIGKCDIRQGE